MTTSSFKVDGTGFWILKDPAATLDYMLDWEEWLADDTITAATWTLTSGITKPQEAFTDTTTTVWLAGGSAGTTYTATCHITTASGRQEDRSFRVICKDR